MCCCWVGCDGGRVVVVGVGIVEEFVGGVGGGGAGPAEMFVFVVEFVVRVGGEGVFGLVVVVVEGERGGVLGGGGGEAGKGAVAAVVEEVFDGDEGGGEEEEAGG